MKGARQPTSEDDPTALGAILVTMAAITRAALEAIVEEQRKACPAHRIGELLVHGGHCARRDVIHALEAQESLRSRSRARQAMGAVDIARARKRALTEERKRLVDRSESVTRKATRQDHPVVSRSSARQSGQTPAR